MLEPSAKKRNNKSKKWNSQLLLWLNTMKHVNLGPKKLLFGSLLLSKFYSTLNPFYKQCFVGKLFYSRRIQWKFIKFFRDDVHEFYDVARDGNPWNCGWSYLHKPFFYSEILPQKNAFHNVFTWIWISLLLVMRNGAQNSQWVKVHFIKCVCYCKGFFCYSRKLWFTFDHTTTRRIRRLKKWIYCVGRRLDFC